MANELDILTVNAAGTGWVDSVPDAVSTGYQNQNTNLEARTVGQDLSSVRASGSNVIVDISGPIDVDGLPFYVSSLVTLTPSTSVDYYIQVIAGASATQKSLQLITATPVWDPDKYAFYNGSNRVLNWLIHYTLAGPKVSRIIPADDGNIFSTLTGPVEPKSSVFTTLTKSSTAGDPSSFTLTAGFYQFMKITAPTGAIAVLQPDAVGSAQTVYANAIGSDWEPGLIVSDGRTVVNIAFNPFNLTFEYRKY